MITAEIGKACVLLLCFCACQRSEPSPDAPWSKVELGLIYSLSPLPPLPLSPGNRVADDARAAQLGRQLFFDKRLSANGKVACASCHQPQRYFSDGLALSQGLAATDRHAPTLVGVAWQTYLFHDGRKDSLWSQALGPLENDNEHGFDRAALAHLIGDQYRSSYETIFGDMPQLPDTARFPQHARPMAFAARHAHTAAWAGMSPADREAINTVAANAGKALEAFERTLVPQAAPFDRYVSDLKARHTEPPISADFSRAARRGLRAFIGKAQCVNCHNGPLFSDREFHNIGLPAVGGRSGVDVGRSLGAQQVKADEFRCGTVYSDAKNCPELAFLNPKFADFLGAFRTPTLRNVAKTPPYMHDGQMATLSDVLNFYRTLPGQAQVGHRELILQLLDPSVQTDDLLAFLQTLTGPPPPVAAEVP